MGTPRLPHGMHWAQRPFPNSNLLLLLGEAPSLIDSGFGAHAEVTEALTRRHCDGLDWGLNTAVGGAGHPGTHRRTSGALGCR